MVGGGGGANLAGIVYEPELTLDLPRPQSGGTAMNALAHCVEALYRGDLDSASPWRGADRRVAAPSARGTSATSRRERIFSRAPPPPARRWRRTASTSATRWPRPSAAATGCLTVRSMQSACPRRCASTLTWRRSRSKSCRSRPWRSWDDSRASRAFAISEFRRRPGRAGRGWRPCAQGTREPAPGEPGGDRRAAALYLVAGLFVSPPKLRLNQPLGVPTRKDELHGQARRAQPRREVVLGAAIAFLIVSFFNWQEVDLGAFGEAA